MEQYTKCTLCNNPGTIENAVEISRVPCHVKRFADKYFTVWRCSGCKSLHSMEPVDLNEYYRHYPFQQHTLDFHTRKGYANRLRLLEAWGMKANDQILDYGCGAGVFITFLKESGFVNAVGYDAFVEKYSSNEILNKRYDVVVSYDVIEHVDDPRKFLETIKSLLKPNGLLILGTPNASKLKLPSAAPYPIELSQPYHRHILSEVALFDLGAEFGLQAEQSYRRFYFDTLYPGVNTRFMWTYIQKSGGFIDVCVEPPNMEIIRSSPLLWFYSLFGYFFPPRGNIMVSFRNKVLSNANLETEKQVSNL
jgi:2-polyprenyl-3-methyl-5-hydroxy-6-metoxy-1,4-benzoquinol methylase